MARGSKTRYLPFGGSIQLKDAFVKTFTEVLMEMSVEDKIKMKQVINNIVTGINSNNIEKVFLNLDSFDKYFLKNTNQNKIMIMERYKNKENIFFSDEINALTTEITKIDTNLNVLKITEEIKKDIINQQYASQINEHLNQLINYVESSRIKSSDISDPFFRKQAERWTITKANKRGAGKNAHNSASLKNIIYGNSKTWMGQVGDAFLKHLGKDHANILMEMANGEVYTKNKILINRQLFKHSILNELDQEELWDLLYQGKGNDAWYNIGGDLLLAYQGKEILRIQLKTANSQSFYSRIKTKRLANHVLKLQSLLNEIDGPKVKQKCKAIANKIWQIYSNSSFVEIKNNLDFNKDVDELLKSLKLDKK